MNPSTEVIVRRYTEEAGESCDSLSCGSNLDHAALKAGEFALDLGCGLGHEALEAAMAVGPSGRVFGLDVTPTMVRRASSRARREGISNVGFVVGTMESLPFESGTFDVVMSNCAINHAADKARVYAEILRVLKPGGRFVVSDPVSLVPLPAEVKTDPQAWADCYGGALTEEEYLSLITRVGFSEVVVLSRREYLKNGYPFASLTIRGIK